MRVGVPKEIKNHEHRVALTPEGAGCLVKEGHEVWVQCSAGVDSGFDDVAYTSAGATVVDTAAQAWAADLVVKVKEPLACEYRYLRPSLTLFTYLHLAADPALARQLIAHQVCAIGYETVQLPDGSLPLLAPMSRVAGRVAVQLGARFLQRENGTCYPGKGILAGAIEGGEAARAVILGAGNVGLNAAMALAGLGVEVTVLESNRTLIDHLAQRSFERIHLLEFTRDAMRRLLPACDLLVGAALVPGEHAPELLGREDLRLMEAGSVFVDVAIDQGGMAETSRVTTYDDPVYVEEGVLHCCLPNMPGAVPRTSTRALTSATQLYVLKLAAGVASACAGDSALAQGVNTRGGSVCHEGVARALAGLV
ncbi:alanine dehydrogenase [Mariprofundus erugo]|uniref:Alanine dehydrogenase n=1 Tax=Mariprofundus erugo TaxID=2528639 RepID=A0A5R9GJB7_9PROT|nr:alanine dehydrogenase [Mariprofundus erugo]TLS65948.1 alanine dehydrogenase [Mariprofundus erugo]